MTFRKTALMESPSKATLIPWYFKLSFITTGEDKVRGVVALYGEKGAVSIVNSLKILLTHSVDCSEAGIALLDNSAGTIERNNILRNGYSGIIVQASAGPLVQANTVSLLASGGVQCFKPATTDAHM
jgi:parallel beta-helix repeat protein